MVGNALVVSSQESLCHSLFIALDLWLTFVVRLIQESSIIKRTRLAARLLRLATLFSAFFSSVGCLLS